MDEHAIITGEKLQELALMYFGFTDDFRYNPRIATQVKKHFDLHLLTTSYYNPPLLFCYSHRLKDFAAKVHLFLNDFVLITHNSDGKITPAPEVMQLLACPTLKKWFGQNLCFRHAKLAFLPIGMANSQWKHGNLSVFKTLDPSTLHRKTQKVYFFFNIQTNAAVREPCYHALQSKLSFLSNVSPHDNVMRLKEYEFCICPEGNGPDTHRLWECLYLKTVPIVIQSPFAETLQQTGIPLVILPSWHDFEASKLDYSHYSFDAVQAFWFENMKRTVLQTIHS